MSVRLIVLTAGKWRGKSILVKRLPIVIGQDASCHLRLTNPLVSNRHCALLAREGKVYVRDLKSTNGTFLNGERVVGERELHENDWLRVGPVDFDVHIEGLPSVREPTPLPPPERQGTANEEDVAALLLGIQDEPGPPVKRVALEGPPPEPSASAASPPEKTEDAEPETPKPPPAPRPPADMPTAASALLNRYLRRPSPKKE
jgi:predicted component of type VI protein secretion system